MTTAPRNEFRHSRAELCQTRLHIGYLNGIRDQSGGTCWFAPHSRLRCWLWVRRAIIQYADHPKRHQSTAKMTTSLMIQGGLFTRDFLLEGVTAEPAWQALSAGTLGTARARLEGLLAPLARQRAPNEAETEAHLVFPVLEQVLGWAEWLPQQNLSATGRLDVPDALLFADAATLERAGGEPPWQRFQHGLCLVEFQALESPTRPACRCT